jgi:long-chain acyl-CoA synthetase
MPAGCTREHADSVGVVLPAADIRVMDDDGRELPPGETGELWIGGPMVVPGYWANEEATAASFTAGYWQVGRPGLDRRAGFRACVRPQEGHAQPRRLQDLLGRGREHLLGWPGVVEAAVVGKPCPVLGERVHAFVHAPGARVDEAALRAHCAAQLADYKVPESVTFTDTPLPRNANGKLMKRLLREQLPR